MNLAAITAGISTLEKIVPVIETIAEHIGPLVETEVADGKVLWADIVKAYQDLKAAVEGAKTAVQSTGK